MTDHFSPLHAVFAVYILLSECFPKTLYDCMVGIYALVSAQLQLYKKIAI